MSVACDASASQRERVTAPSRDSKKTRLESRSMQTRFALLRSFMLLRDRENRYHATSAHPTAPEHHPCRRLCSGCAICLAEPVSMLCRPCNHVAACVACAPRLAGRPCPLCRRVVASIERIYL